MEPAVGKIWLKSPISTFQQGLTHSALAVERRLNQILNRISVQETPRHLPDQASDQAWLKCQKRRRKWRSIKMAKCQK